MTEGGVKGTATATPCEMDEQLSWRLVGTGA